MLVITVDFRAVPGAEAAFLARVRRQAAESLAAEPGCRRFDVCTDPGDGAYVGGHVFLYEIYDDDAAFAAHLASAHYASFDADARALVAAKEVSRWHLTG